MEPDVDGKQTSLYEMLGMTADDAKRITEDFAVLLTSSESLRDLCRLMVEKYGMEAVAMSFCLRMTFEVLDIKRAFDDRTRVQCRSMGMTEEVVSDGT